MPRTFVLLALPVSIQKLNEGTRVEKLLRQRSKHLAARLSTNLFIQII
jgi:hypothetical protein